ncbi:GIY-YIG nuclease family protein [Paraburkholderia sp. C35]|uniref:GIY-YIG nuclease family protein n=1 Tax=Paraburkholderia sp. C35 TaxID=2126993 RepID=UPI0013A5B664|nr:GIY-YIG nuclease family protein [Paraburkholderia sp. C35]
MAAREPGSSATPDDAEALAAARAEFWARWRGELPSYAEARHLAARQIPRRSAATGTKCDSPSVHVVSATTRRKAEGLLDRFERLIEKELARCERCMTRDEWREHREWIEEHARGSLWEALIHRSHKGML